MSKHSVRSIIFTSLGIDSSDGEGFPMVSKVTQRVEVIDIPTC